MPKQGKALENMAKHLTKAERDARAKGEQETTPKRTNAKLVMPPYVKNDKIAAKYWRSILKRMAGVYLLDDLDSEPFGVYCAMLSRHDTAQGLTAVLLDDVRNGELKPDERKGLLEELNGLMAEVQSLDRVILQYADKLGLTPAGRVRLARKRAEAVAEPTPDSDLFGE